ncbi:M23 family metallopeptidase [Virgibacillus ihumii]|uniref:M23 family metallopeptidase n=1 Tax=Virgibacillus ihumii TaxID=2686091 RepID=UPI00157D5C13|nr:M23 family metallopeptidase [Virgibacillus ihumii]
MKEENNGTPKNKWSRIFRKKWFFPAVYLTVAAVLLAFVVWYQNLENQMPDMAEDQKSTDFYNPAENQNEAQPVMEQQEVIKMPVVNQDQAEIVTNFYDYNADTKAKKSALVLYNNRYYQSKGVNIKAAEGESFDVLAALSGTVKEVKEDPLLGQVVTLQHENKVITHYASLGDVNVKAGAEVQQGDVIGTAGENRFGQEFGTHVHFEIRKNGEAVNPEKFFNQPVSALNKAVKEDSSSGNAEENDSATEEENAGETEDGAADSSGDSEGTDDNADGENSDGTKEDSTDNENNAGESSEQNQEDTNNNAEDDNTTDNDTTESSASSASA